MQILTKKTMTTVIAILLVSAMAFTCIPMPTVNAHTPAWQIKTYAYVTASPNPVGIGQQVLVVFWVDKVFDPTITVTNDWRFHNYKLTITLPDGTTDVRNFPTVVDTTSVQTITYVPEALGTYNFKFEFPGQDYNQYSHNPTSTLVNDTYLPSSASYDLIVQQDPIAAPITSYPLPQSFWSHPIYGENTDWWSISSNWLGTGAPVLSQFGSGDLSGYSQAAVIQRYPGDAIGPQTSHVMWTIPVQFGGVVGGNDFPIQGNTYFEGSAYSQRFTNPIIINGILYYTDPIQYTGTTAGPTKAVDIRTGKVIWSRNDVPALSFGYIYDVEDPNQHGVYPPILFTTSFARAFDAYTGNMLFNVSGVPSGLEAMGPQGEHLRYVMTNLGTTANPNYVLAEWNSTKLWTWTGLSPALNNASNNAAWSMSSSAVGAIAVPTGPTAYTPATFIVNGSVFDSSNAQNRYDWNYSIPWRNTLTSAQTPTVLAVFYNNMMLVRLGAYPVLTTAFGVSASSAPYTYLGVNLNATRGQIGNVLWTKTYSGITDNASITFGGADPTVGIFIEGVKETRQWVGYSLTTGDRLWGPVGNQSAWDYFGDPAYDYCDSQVAYGKLYSSAYGGIVYTYDLKNGTLLWTYGNGGPGNSTRSSIGTPAYGGYPTFINAVGNGIIYLVTTEHTIQTPIYKGALARAINATDGKEIWTLSAYTGEFGSMSEAIADGFAILFNGYDNQVYSVGRGPSTLTVTAPSTGLAFGTPVVIKGTVMDISAGTKQDTQAVNFPNGAPVASDAMMGDWMRYVYQQGPLPTNFVGVPVTIDVLDSNNNYRTIGTAMTDATGVFSLTWTPDIPGNFTLVATFHGSNAYWPSWAGDSFTVMEKPEAPPTAAPSVTEMYFIPAVVAIIVVIIIVGAVLAILTIRKRP